MKLNFYERIIIIVTILSVQSLVSFGQNNFFSTVSPSSSARMTPLPKTIAKMASFHLDELSMRKHLLKAPLQFHNNSITIPLDIPLPDGQVETFNLVETPVLSPAAAALHPEIKTYTGNGTKNKRAVITISLTSSGFNAIILNIDGVEAVYVEKFDEIYGSYFSKDIKVPSGKNLINVPEGVPPLRKQGSKPTHGSMKTTAEMSSLSTGTTLRTFKLSMAATAEFTANHGGSISGGYDALVGYVTRMNAFYVNELSIVFELVSTDSFVFTNPLTDPFTNDDDDKLFIENKTLVDGSIGLANYDVAFVMGANGEGFSSGGVAYFEALCVDDIKAGSVAKEGDIAYYAQYYFDKTLFHEMGHKVGMSHSYNSTIPVCTSREAYTSVEPGSGASIMSYGFKCGSDDYFVSDTDGLILNFHSVSYNQAVAFLATVVGGTSAATGNTPPVITMPSNYTIPKSTPFSLTGSATDDDGDALTYSWEGTNIGTSEPTTTTFSNTAEAPFFRSFAPIESGTRTFPQIDRILDGSNYGCNRGLGDKLPSVSVITTHTLTVRDNRAGGGGVTNASVDVTVDGESGPFLITNDTPLSLLGLKGNHLPGSAQVILWSVNGTFGAPVKCTLVDIFLSYDGGLTFPVTLLEAVPNIGTALVVFPLDANTTTARIKVSASSNPGAPVPARFGRTMATTNTPNVFFDISNVDFSIMIPLPVTLAAFDVALKQKNNALLTWKTTEEVNNSGFDIEMSTDAKKFTKVGYVEGKGDSKELNIYSYTVSDLSGGNYYFRLKQLDYDGKFEYSTIKALQVDKADDIVSIYPNPTKDKVKINTSMHQNGAFSIEVSNQGGQIVLQLPASASYTNGYELDATSFATGLYFIVLKGTRFTEKLKFVKL